MNIVQIQDENEHNNLNKNETDFPQSMIKNIHFQQIKTYRISKTMNTAHNRNQLAKNKELNH